MKRLNNLYSRIISIENLQLADTNARKGKAKQYGVLTHDKRRNENISDLHEMLKNKTYRTSEYTTFKIHEPKEREVFRLPYFPDRITHHAVMNVLEPVFVSNLTSNTYSCIKGKGIHALSYDLRYALKYDKPNTQYCLKLDIKKFYPSVNHDVLKMLLERKFKDADLLWLLFEIIDSAEGLPIGNYLSQYFGNFYLSPFDHWLKEVRKVKYCFRYCDDIVILASNKSELHELLAAIKIYLSDNLKLTVKANYRIFPVNTGIDIVGYVHFHTHTLLRKSIKQNFARMLAKRRNQKSINSYNGWAKHCDSKQLLKKLLK